MHVFFVPLRWRKRGFDRAYQLSRCLVLAVPLPRFVSVRANAICGVLGVRQLRTHMKNSARFLLPSCESHARLGFTCGGVGTAPGKEVLLNSLLDWHLPSRATWWSGGVLRTDKRSPEFHPARTQRPPPPPARCCNRASSVLSLVPTFSWAPSRAAAGGPSAVLRAVRRARSRASRSCWSKAMAMAA